MTRFQCRAFILLAALSLVACQTPPAVAPVADPNPAPYFEIASFDVAQILPPPPAPGTPAADVDLQAVRRAVAEATAERRALAIADAELNVAARFAGALGRSLDSDDLPRTGALFARVYADGARVAAGVKARFGRLRPLVADESIAFCWPEQRAVYARDLSYPSGHAAWGWAAALILAEMVPERAVPILERGREFGESRVVCGVHYPTDVEGGRVYAASWVARLHAEPQFESDLAAARSELRAALSLPAQP